MGKIRTRILGLADIEKQQKGRTKNTFRSRKAEKQLKEVVSETKAVTQKVKEKDISTKASSFVKTTEDKPTVENWRESVQKGKKGKQNVSKKIAEKNIWRQKNLGG